MKSRHALCSLAPTKSHLNTEGGSWRAARAGKSQLCILNEECQKRAHYKCSKQVQEADPGPAPEHEVPSDNKLPLTHMLSAMLSRLRF